MVAKIKFNFRGLWFTGLVLAFSSCISQEIQVLPGKVEAQTVPDDPSPSQLSGASIFQIPGYFVWGGSVVQGEDGKYHSFFAVVKDFTGRISGVKMALALLTSKDGISWKVAGNPLFMKRELYLQYGSVLKVDRLERPQLLIDEAGAPKVMYAACSLGNVNIRNDGCSFNVQIPLEIANE